MAKEFLDKAGLAYFKSKLDVSYDSKYALKGDVTSAVTFKGSTTFADLPTNAKVGDMYNVTDRHGMNYVWTGTAWDAVGDMTVAEWESITGKPSTFTPSAHTHTKSQITDFPTALKNPAALTIKLNGGNATSYDGSTAKEVNITAAAIGAATASHSHTPFTGATASAAGTAGIVPAPAAGKQDAYLRGDGTWAVIGVATSSAAGLMSSTDKTKLDSGDMGVPISNTYIDSLFTA